MTTPLPAPATRMPAAPGVDYESLVEGNLLRYATGNQQTTRRVNLPTRGHRELLDRSDRQFMWAMAAGALALLVTLPTVAINVFGDGSFLDDVLFLLVVALGIVVMGAGSLSVLTWERARDGMARQVPVPVSEAYCRLHSAVREAERSFDDGVGNTDAVATLRVMRDNGEDLVRLLADHHDGGTAHCPEAVEARGELFRMAAEADAYLTLRRHNDALQADNGDAHPAVEAARHSTLNGLALEERNTP